MLPISHRRLSSLKALPSIPINVCRKQNSSESSTSKYRNYVSFSDAWPWNCLDLRYYTSLREHISNSSSDIFDAANKGYIGFVQYYLEKEHAKLGLREDGQTALHLAVKNGNLDVVKYIAMKVTVEDLNRLNSELNTPLMYAAYFGRLNIAKYLVDEKQVDASYHDTDRNIVLNMAAQGGNLNLLKYFVDHKGYTVKKGNQKLLLSAALGGNVDLLKYLIYKKNLTKIGTDAKGDTGLHKAALMGRLGVVQFFTDTLRYKVDAQNFEDSTPAHSAAEGGRLFTLRYLVEKKQANLNARNAYGESLLHIAAHYGHLIIVKYLVDVKGMNIELKDYTLKTPLHRAVLQNHLDVVKYLAGEKWADLSSKDKDGKNLLHHAVYTGNVELMRFLIDDMKMIYMIDEVDPILHRTAALEAAYWGRFPILIYLIDGRNAKPWIVDSEGKNLLHIAAREGELKIVKYLIEDKNFDVNAKTPSDLTAYDLATNCEDEIRRKELLQYLKEKMNPDTDTEAE